MNSRNSLNRIFHYALSVVLLCVSQVACTASSLPPYEANYTTKMRGIRINSERQFVEIAEDTYRLSWSAKALWMKIKEWSEFKIVNDQVIPLSYHYTRKGLGSDRPIHIVFDWEKMQAEGRKGKATTQFSLEPGTLDKLSFQVQMQLDLLNRPDKRTFAFRIASHNALRDYIFDYEADETIDTELGRFDTLIFKREKTDSTIRLWMSPQQYYLPVKVQQTGDDANTVVIKSWKSEERPVIDSGQPQQLDSSVESAEESDFDDDQPSQAIDNVDAPVSLQHEKNTNGSFVAAPIISSSSNNTELPKLAMPATLESATSTNDSVTVEPSQTIASGLPSESTEALAPENTKKTDIKCTKNAT